MSLSKVVNKMGSIQSELRIICDTIKNCHKESKKEIKTKNLKKEKGNE